MLKRGRSHCKPAHRRMTDLPVSNGRNSFGSIFCSVGGVHDFRIKCPRPVIRDSHLKTVSAVDLKRAEDKNNNGNTAGFHREKNNQSPKIEWYENDCNLMCATSKKSSVAFFVPINNCIARHMMTSTDWNELLSYGRNASAMLSRYQFKNRRKNVHGRNSIPESKSEPRSSSESSSVTSDDSIVFTNDDSLFDDDDASSSTNSSAEDSDQEGNDELDCASPGSKEISTEEQVKKVRFVDNSELVTTHVIVAWNYAYRAARKSPWEVVARDSSRFKSKIQSLEPILSPVLRLEHRQKIWETRMLVN